MRRSLTGPLLVIAAVACLFSGTRAAEWIELDPTHFASKTKMMVDDKPFTYYRFSHEEPVSFSIEGPTRVKVLTRVRIPNDADTLAYAVTVLRDGALATTEENVAPPSRSGYYVGLNSFRPGAIRRVYIDVPTGLHGYELRAGGRTVVDARIFRSAAAKPSRVSLAPVDYASVETLYYRDKELTYYLVTKGKPVELEIVGPTSIKVNTRLLYDSTMLASQTYMVGVKESGDVERLYKVDSEPSETVVCRDRDDVIPGALRYFMVEVPRGRHRYEFRLVDTVARALAIKFYIPRGDLANEP